MASLRHKNNLLLVIALLLAAFMTLFALAVGDFFNKATAYTLTTLVYWYGFCMPLAFYYLGGVNGVKAAYKKPAAVASSFRLRLLSLLAFVPCLGTLFAVFLPNVANMPVFVLGIALFYALLNGAIEELFWRGVFIKAFPSDPVGGWLVPTFFFGVWHTALYSIKGMTYQGGFAALVGGSALMGLLWGLVAFKTRSIRAVTIAHIVTNFFAFSGMIYENFL